MISRDVHNIKRVPFAVLWVVSPSCESVFGLFLTEFLLQVLDEVFICYVETCARIYTVVVL